VAMLPCCSAMATIAAGEATTTSVSCRNSAPSVTVWMQLSITYSQLPSRRKTGRKSSLAAYTGFLP